MAKESFEERTEKATPKKRQEVRQKGQVARSRELPSVAILLVAVATMTLFGAYMFSHFRIIANETLSLPGFGDFSRPEFMEFAQEMISLVIMILLPVFAAVFLTALFSNIIQVGFLFTAEAISPKLSRMNPVSGFGRLFSKNALVELLKSLFKLALIGCIAYYTIKGELDGISRISELELEGILLYILGTLFKIFVRCILAMIVLAVLDYGFQRWDFENQIKMTKKEIKEEHKISEGDPQIKAKIRRIQMQMAMKRMMQAVPKADVVITNPTHIAVALKYDGDMNAPRVTAKGAGEIARRIREIAEEHRIPIIENRELARSLNEMVEIDREIPPSLYQAVAEILAYIYRLRRGNATGGS